MFNITQDDNGNYKLRASGGGSETDGNFGIIFDENPQVPIEAGLGRGTGTNVSGTNLFLTRNDGVRVYLSVPTGTTLVVSTTKP